MVISVLIFYSFAKLAMHLEQLLLQRRRRWRRTRFSELLLWILKEKSSLSKYLLFQTSFFLNSLQTLLYISRNPFCLISNTKYFLNSKLCSLSNHIFFFLQSKVQIFKQRPITSLNHFNSQLLLLNSQVNLLINLPILQSLNLIQMFNGLNNKTLMIVNKFSLLAKLWQIQS